VSAWSKLLLVLLGAGLVGVAAWGLAQSILATNDVVGEFWGLADEVDALVGRSSRIKPRGGGGFWRTIIPHSLPQAAPPAALGCMAPRLPGPCRALPVLLSPS
jgi:hypothetical protein